MKLAVLGLSITSAWGNGHATTYRALLKAMAARGHEVLFLERDVPWYSAHRDLAQPAFCRVGLYTSLAELKSVYGEAVRSADAVIVGSFVPEGVEVGLWACQTAEGPVAFYDIDTPVTLGKLESGDYEYLHPEQIPLYDLYLSFATGPVLNRLEREYGAPRARPLCCSVDPELYYPQDVPERYLLGYMGTYCPTRQPGLEMRLLEPAGRMPEESFVVAGPQFPEDLEWPANVRRIEHVVPSEHSRFYNEQAFTLNLTRTQMVQAGYSPLSQKKKPEANFLASGFFFTSCRAA